MKSIQRKIKSAEERVQRLKLLSQRAGSYEDYQMSSDLKDLAERNLQVAIEGCLDIGKIIISTEGLEEPKDNKGIFVVLADSQNSQGHIQYLAIPSSAFPLRHCGHNTDIGPVPPNWPTRRNELGSNGYIEPIPENRHPPGI